MQAGKDRVYHGSSRLMQTGVVSHEPKEPPSKSYYLLSRSSKFYCPVIGIGVQLDTTLLVSSLLYLAYNIFSTHYIASFVLFGLTVNILLIL